MRKGNKTEFYIGITVKEAVRIRSGSFAYFIGQGIGLKLLFKKIYLKFPVKMLNQARQGIG